jgi:pyruvate ferredoxin oxidoreductase gamma subunit
MYRIRFHGRGGQGLKTASRILGTAFFLQGYEVQDAPRYGAERRGAPIFAFVRADTKPINERGVINNPDLVVVADDSLIAIPAAGVLQGLTAETVLLILSHHSANEWQHRLNCNSTILTLPPFELNEDIIQSSTVGTICTAAAASLLDVISLDVLEQAIQQELSMLDKLGIKKNLQAARKTYAELADQKIHISEKVDLSAVNYQSPEWVEVPFDEARISAPVIHAGLTSVEVRTGLWRTMRPVINYDLCNHCWWVCSSFCPDSAINVDKENYPQIDYDHCKGCLICVAQCPPHAITAIAENKAQNMDQGISLGLDSSGVKS